ncbi:hypothetical protein HAQ06_20895 [Pseudomonas sp. C2L12B]|uniref:Cucumopine synthase C-terminal helical bundle domain-containing protein n=1 Tax=Pseudomonas typographi TaxID=2715964 RepID=A0ABR7YYW3_9PSED|nr:hypothetical protein [Pseudomonas typographi]MBD1589100.1 hypothetical protein [Pseudomonas typographi]MBD1598379.1 hypothetical protein [Pseudomonas typographi]
MTTEQMIERLEREREAIWRTLPDEVAAIGRGEIPRGTGARGQYLSTLMFAEGEARTLADEMFWGLIEVCRQPGADLATLKMIISQIIGYKADFFDFVGLPAAAALVHQYVSVAEVTTSVGELERLTGAALSWANRFHMWVDHVYPWGVGDGFRRPKAKVA